MATKLSVFGQEFIKTKKLKKIDFVKYISAEGVVMSVDKSQLPQNWDNVQLFAKSDFGYFDTILAWDDDYETKTTFLGYWNDGIV